MSVIINGGGITGLILALKLSQLTQGNLKISLIEKYSPFCDKNLFSFRNPDVVALSRGAYSELMKIHINPISSIYSTTINQIEISEYNGFNTVFIQAQDYQLSELGYVIELFSIRKKLFNLLHKQPGVNIYYPAVIKKIKRRESHSIVFLDNGKQITSKLIIAADGFYSKLANSFGIQWFQWNYYQTAIVSNVTTEIPHFGRAFEKFTPFGPLAFLPISNGLSFFIWCVSNQKKKEILKWNNNKFSQELQNMFGWKLGKILNVKKIYFYDLWLMYAKNHVAHRLALVGNAAQKLHPIAGQGLNLGIRDVLVLSKIIYQALCDNIDIGDYSVLYEYQKSRRSDQYETITITDSLIRIFGSHYLPLIIARSVGLFCIEHFSFLKRFLINKALYWKLN